jgi:hypothetical protein
MVRPCSLIIASLDQRCRQTAFGRPFVVYMALTQPPREGGMNSMNWAGTRTLCGIGVFVFGLLLIAHLLGRLEPHLITTLLVAGAGFCAFWWRELGKR